jgi:hypothetical protein
MTGKTSAATRHECPDCAAGKPWAKAPAARFTPAQRHMMEAAAGGAPRGVEVWGKGMVRTAHVLEACGLVEILRLSTGTYARLTLAGRAALDAETGGGRTSGTA